MEDYKKSIKDLTRSQRRRRDDIVEAAIKVFDRDGFEAARIIDVANEAEMAKGTVYLYFENKHALLEGVVKAIIVPAIEAVAKVAESPSGPASEILERQIATMADRLGKGDMKSILRLMIAEGPKHDSMRRFYYDNVVAPGMAAIGRTLVYGVERGEFSKAVIDVSPHVFAGPPLLSAVWRILFDDLSPLDTEKLFQDQIFVTLNGLRRDN